MPAPPPASYHLCPGRPFTLIVDASLRRVIKVGKDGRHPRLGSCVRRQGAGFNLLCFRNSRVIKFKRPYLGSIRPILFYRVVAEAESNSLLVILFS
jgi:hypothetical protein